MRAVVGILDDPYNARILPLVVDFTKGHAVLFGASGWGKTTFLRTLIVSLASTHSPDEFQAHILDLGGRNLEVLKQVGLSEAQVEDMYHVMAIANYEDRFVIPSTHREYAENTFNVRGGCGFSFGNGCSEGVGETSLFGSEKKRTIPIRAEV